MLPPKPPATSMPGRRGGETAERVIVAVKAKKVISKSGLTWALTHVTRPGDCVTLLAIACDNKTGGRRFWVFPKLKGNSRSVDPSRLPDRICQISESCSQMVLQVQDQIQVRVQIRVVSIVSAGCVAAEAKSSSASWVVLDKKLKQELKHCMDELHCNIVVMKGSCPKVLRLNLAGSNGLQTPFYSTTSSPIEDSGKLHATNMKYTTPVSSPEDPSTSYTTPGENSLSSPDTGASFFVVYEQNPLYERLNKGKYPLSRLNTFEHLRGRAINVSAFPESATYRNHEVVWIAQNHNVDGKDQTRRNCNNISKTACTSARTKSDYFVPYEEDMLVRGLEFNQNHSGDYAFNSSIREAVSLSKTSSTPPPLCSYCQSKAPSFGKPPLQFQYKELEESTAGFSEVNFVAEGGFGWVHRGVLRNGFNIAVKQLKLVGPQRDADFCREVQVLSCAQHRNVVLLIGFCIEKKKRLLIYEYICNGSLDLHLHGHDMPILDWHARLKIAIGTARGLRYLHEDCRVGRIIHRNLRPNNILLTHDFEPLVADFGLARLHSEWNVCDSNQVVETSGYLAPEFFNNGTVTEKVDIYAFGLVLLELITGQRAQDLQYCMEHQFLRDNIYTLVATEPIHILAYKHQLLDPRLASSQLKGLPYELHAMGCAASLCLQQDPDKRPPMSKVVKMLEGGNPVTPLALDLESVGCRSGHMQGVNSNALLESKSRHSRRLSY